jgi:sec-independent protein translocase protein TatB
MFDFGFWELVLIAVVALLVVGPERLPGVARQAGLWIGRARRFMNSVRSDIKREIQAEELKEVLNKQQSELKELKGMLMETQSDVKTELEETDHLVKSIEDQLQSTHTQEPGKQNKQEQ